MLHEADDICSMQRFPGDDLYSPLDDLSLIASMFDYMM